MGHQALEHVHRGGGADENADRAGAVPGDQALDVPGDLIERLFGADRRVCTIGLSSHRCANTVRAVVEFGVLPALDANIAVCREVGAITLYVDNPIVLDRYDHPAEAGADAAIGLPLDHAELLIIAAALPAVAEIFVERL